ncbi:MAG: hypothetical protein FWC41_01640, partial [Firmicutes bacterium]|nr:hypothetical protein [Bacillota bacterium]
NLSSIVWNIEFLRDFFSKQGKKRRNTCCISIIFKDVLWEKIQKAIFSVLKTGFKNRFFVVTKEVLLC